MNRKPIQFNITKTGCLEVISHKSRRHPHLWIRGKRVLAHRYIYALAYGPIPIGKVIRHLCNNPMCINPAHLKAGTQKENIQDAIKAGTQTFIGVNHCKAKLSEAEVLEIRASKFRDEALAERYNVARTTISRIKNNKTWRHLIFGT